MWDAQRIKIYFRFMQKDKQNLNRVLNSPFHTVQFYPPTLSSLLTERNCNLGDWRKYLNIKDLSPHTCLSAYPVKNLCPLLSILFYTVCILVWEASLDPLLLQNVIFIAVYTYRVVINNMKLS